MTAVEDTMYSSVKIRMSKTSSLADAILKWKSTVRPLSITGHTFRYHWQESHGYNNGRRSPYRNDGPVPRDEFCSRVAFFHRAVAEGELVFPGGPAMSDRKHHRVLVVDDDLPFLEATRTMLEEHGYDVVTAQ